jgi:GTP-dependent phosphoenolpyruvate carboxykinase
VDIEGWLGEAAGLSAYYDEFGDRLPAALRGQLTALQERLNRDASTGARQ